MLKQFLTRLATSFGANPLPLNERIAQECLRYHWPGNLRELGNFVKRYLVLKDEDLIRDELKGRSLDPLKSIGVRCSSGGLKGLVKNLTNDAECRAIERTLKETGWNRKMAAAKLNISYKAVLIRSSSTESFLLRAVNAKLYVIVRRRIRFKHKCLTGQ